MDEAANHIFCEGGQRSSHPVAPAKRPLRRREKRPGFSVAVAARGGNGIVNGDHEIVTGLEAGMGPYFPCIVKMCGESPRSLKALGARQR